MNDLCVVMAQYGFQSSPALKSGCYITALYEFLNVPFGFNPHPP